MHDALSGCDPMELYRAARRAVPSKPDAIPGSMSGSYHQNVRVDIPGGPVLVRIPLPRADQMDLRVWNEWEVLGTVAHRVERVPRLLHVSADPPFQIHEFISGGQLNELAPRGRRVPPTVIPDVLVLFEQLGAIRRADLPALPAHWPEDGNCVAFAHLVSAATQRVYDDHRERFGPLQRALGIPDDPLAPVRAAWPALASRPFRVLHADVHRRNIVMSVRGAVFLDWELALWGDPLYDLAVHLNKMTYLDDERRALLSGWAAGAGPATGWSADLTAYLRHERVKAAIVHSIRYPKEIAAAGTTAARRRTLVRKLTGNLNAAASTWNTSGPPLDPHDVDRLLSRWGAGAVS
ncbi:MAG TPA: aminoglycoside phosphotransferase family protein [Pseudonocardiaceae bacterium]|nr:aminoglycoside phosphotransferase family protein [Pseudonocardiaceae bacterium]